MKSLKKISTSFKNLLAILMLCLVQTTTFAQDKKVDVNISTDKGGGDWYAQPWVWIVGGAVFLLLLVALMRGNSNKD
ncbi:MAG: hypothetical protein H7Y07_01210 [Pyrinomonadaceae bacterium]|nr:hypothetical protein [Sphingobacteriaceae bacterium]